MGKFFYSGVVTMVLFSIAFSANAQLKSYGPEGGINLIPVSKNKIDKTIYNLGYNAGLFAEYEITDRLAVKAELLYTMTRKAYNTTTSASIDSMLVQGMGIGGGETQGISTDSILDIVREYANLDITETKKYNANLAYIKLPVCIVLNLKRVKFSAGVYGAYMVSALTREEFSQHIPILEAIKVIEDQQAAKFIIKMLYPAYYKPKFDESTSKVRYNEIDWGFTAGMSYHPTERMVFGISYCFGMEDFYHKPPEGFETLMANQSFISLTLGYDLGKTDLSSIVKF